MRRIILFGLCVLACAFFHRSASAEPLYSVSGLISGEVGYYSENIFQSLSPESIGATRTAPSGTTASVESSSDAYRVYNFASVQGPSDFAEGLHANGNSTVEDLFVFVDEDEQPILSGTVEVVAFYTGEASFSGPASGAYMSFFLHVFEPIFNEGGEDFIEFDNTTGGSGFLTAQWTGDFSEGVVVALQGQAFTQGGTFETGNPTNGTASALAYIQSITVNGVPVFTIPEPTSCSIMALGGVGILLLARKRLRRARA